MGKFASGKNAIAISDRSGLRFPYTEMVKEWNGMWVHYSEFEIKQPQLDLAVIGPDGVALEHPRPPQRTTPGVAVMLPENPFETYLAGNPKIFTHSPNHGRNNDTIVRFRGTPDQSTSTGPSGWPPTPANGAAGYSDCLDVSDIPGSVICQAAGYTISVGKRGVTVSTTLVSNIDASQTTGIILTNPDAGVGSQTFRGVTTNNFLKQAVLIDSEIIIYTTIASDDSLGQVAPEATAINPNVVTRGALGTTKAAHLAAAVVTLINDPTNYFTFEKVGSNATDGGVKGGGFPVSAGPVTLTP
tara:strand:- start:55 stop:954 length:900 start_codon:yes stop_codon:yes gene_type:complete